MFSISEKLQRSTHDCLHPAHHSRFLMCPEDELGGKKKKTCLGGWERESERERRKKCIFLLTKTSPRQGSSWPRCCLCKPPVTIMFNCSLIVLHELPRTSCRHEKLGNQGDIRAQAQAPPLPCGSAVMYMPHWVGGGWRMGMQLSRETLASSFWSGGCSQIKLLVTALSKGCGF